MAGDSVLDIFNDIMKYGWAGALFLVILIIYFSMFIITIFTTVVTDSYFTLIDKNQMMNRF